MIFIVIFLLELLISTYAAYLSYSCISQQTGTFSQILFTLLAFLLGPIYLIYYFFTNYLTGGCNK